MFSSKYCESNMSWLRCGPAGAAASSAQSQSKTQPIPSASAAQKESGEGFQASRRFRFQQSSSQGTKVLDRLPKLTSAAERDEQLRELRAGSIRSSTQANYRIKLRFFASYIRREDIRLPEAAAGAFFPASADLVEVRRGDPVALSAENFRIFLHACLRAEVNFEHIKTAKWAIAWYYKLHYPERDISWLLEGAVDSEIDAYKKQAQLHNWGRGPIAGAMLTPQIRQLIQCLESWQGRGRCDTTSPPPPWAAQSTDPAALRVRWCELGWQFMTQYVLFGRRSEIKMLRLRDLLFTRHAVWRVRLRGANAADGNRPKTKDDDCQYAFLSRFIWGLPHTTTLWNKTPPSLSEKEELERPIVTACFFRRLVIESVATFHGRDQWRSILNRERCVVDI